MLQLQYACAVMLCFAHARASPPGRAPPTPLLIWLMAGATVVVGCATSSSSWVELKYSTPMLPRQALRQRVLHALPECGGRAVWFASPGS